MSVAERRMPTARTTTAESGKLTVRLRRDHRSFESRFDDLCARAHAADPIDLDSVWDDFAADLESHLVFEESQVLPEFAAERAENQEVARRLLADHAEIRRTLARLGVDLLVNRISAESIHAFVGALRRHADLEDATVYAWLMRRDQGGPP